MRSDLSLSWNNHILDKIKKLISRLKGILTKILKYLLHRSSKIRIKIILVLLKDQETYFKIILKT